MKQTEIDGVADTLIPDDWEVKRLGELFEMRAGGDVNKQHFSYYKSDKYKYKIFSNGLENEGVYGFTDLPRYKGDSITITGRGTVGVSMYRKDDFDAVIRLLVLESRNKNQTNNFFISELINEVVKFPNESTGVPQLTVPQIKDVLIPLPPLPEQQRIAKALSDVDALISTTEKLIQKKKNIKQGAMQNLLTGKKRLPGFGPQTKSPAYKQTELGLIPEDWEVKSLGESFDIGSSKRVFQSQWRKSGIPFYRAREIVMLAEKNTVENELFIDETLYNQYKTLYGVPAVNDLLVTGVGTLGKVYKVQNTNPFYFKDGNIICLKNKGSINSDYVSYHFDYYIVKDQINDNSGKSTVGTYTINSARKTIIPVPSVPEQTAIANVLSSMDKEIETLNTNLEKYRNLKTAMMQQLLTGKIRL